MRLSLVVLLCFACPAAGFELRKGDHICVVGDGLAERMQHDGRLEAMLQAACPEHELVVRHLGFAGDEVATRLRSAGFGSPNQWLRMCRADVVIACFGANEAHGGEAGLGKFRSDLDDYLKSLLQQKFNGRSSPRVVLVGPIRFVNPGNPRLPDGQAINAARARYVEVMREIAARNSATFVSLFVEQSQPWTHNGIHLNEWGQKEVARLIFGSMMTTDPPAHEHLITAVRDKDFHWFQRYRTTDGYSIHGGRADLKFVGGQTNRVVAEREMEILEVMTANRDRVIWSAARGKVVPADDSNLPPFIPVVTNKPGPGPGGKHLFLSGDESIAQMKLGRGLKVNLFASEERFPDLINPVQMTWDARGRLWVAVWPTYPHWKPTEPMNDKILILEDTDGDGRADKQTVFADGLHNPTGFELVSGGVIVANCPDLIFLKDTDGNDQADVKERVLHGLDSADTHHAANSFVLDPGGAIYMQEGTFHHTQVETPWGPPVRNINAGVYRYEPKTHRFETYIAYGFANPHGHVFDRWGQDIVVDGTGSQPYHAALFSGHMPYPMRHATPPQVYQQRTRPCPSIEIVSSRHFPDDWQGNLLVGNVIGIQGILRYRIDDDGASFRGTELEEVVSSRDPNFRPSDIKIGPDGAIYFSDWHNPIIGHMQHNLRDPSRDRTHGRIYRITHADRPLSRMPAIVGQSIEGLLELLKHPDDRVRYRVRGELGERPTDQVIPALDAWLARLDPPNANIDHHRLESLWVRQWHDRVDESALLPVLRCWDFRARAAAVRIVCHQRHRLPAALDLLRSLAADGHPRVRLEVIRAASYFRTPLAMEVALVAAEPSGDRFVDFVMSETRRSLEPVCRQAMASGQAIAWTTDRGRAFGLRLMPRERLLQGERTVATLGEILVRPGMSDDDRKLALRDLSGLNRQPIAATLIDAVQKLDRDGKDADRSAVYDLSRMLSGMPPNDVAAERERIGDFATKAARPEFRQVSLAVLARVDGTVDRVVTLAERSTTGRIDLALAVPLFNDPAHRVAIYPRLSEWLQSKDAKLRQAAMSAIVTVRGKESESFAALAKIAREGPDRPGAIRALRLVPAQYWLPEQTSPLLESLIQLIEKTPKSERTTGLALDALSLADALAGALPADAARAARVRLRDLGVRVIRVGTLAERMAFDRETLAVRVGETVEIIFENLDLMPHNLVVAQPGSLESVGAAAEASANDPAAAARHYVPVGRDVLLGSKLLQPGQSQRLSFVAPQQPGVYPFVCTYPGHWRTMHGAIYVVADLEAFQADPTRYLASHPIEVRDPMLRDRRPRTEWKYEDLAEAAAAIKSGRSYAQGKQMFTVANCIACHKLDGVGQEYGPDLTQSDPKWTALDVWREIVDPSARINEKYQSYVFQLASGQTTTGLIVGETAEAYRVAENPIAGAEPREIRKDEIESKQKATHSLMPKGLVEKLSREELLDLLAYVTARGRRDHPLFGAGQLGGHGHTKPAGGP